MSILQIDFLTKYWSKDLFSFEVVQEKILKKNNVARKRFKIT
jgi:hypothetical protein